MINCTLNKKRILVTGSNGLLGQKLIGLLKDQINLETWGTSRGANRLPYAEGYQYFSADLTVETEVENMLAAVKPDILIHTAAMTHVDVCEGDKEGCWLSNVTAVEYLLKGCEKHHIFLLHLSTDFIFDGQSGPYHEEDEPCPVNFYGWSKYAAEKLIQRSNVRWAIARTVLVYGIAHDMSRSNLILWVKKSLQQGKNIQVVSDQFRTPTLAEDLAKGCLLIADQEAEGIFHISGKDFLTPYEMAVETAKFYSLNTALLAETNALSFKEPAMRPPRTGFIIDKAVDQLGFQPVSFAEGLSIMSRQLDGLYKVD